MTTTTDLADFDNSDLARLGKLLTAYRNQGLPREFYKSEVKPMLNTKSGCVFFTNEDFQVAMLNGDNLEMFHTCFECGHEGFHEDCQLNHRGCNECNPEDEEESKECE